MSEGRKSRLATSEPTSTTSSDGAAAPDADDGVTWKHAVARIRQTQQIIRTPNPDNKGYARQKQNGKLWVRERLGALLDGGSFNEVGSLTGKPILDETTGKMKDYLPANMVLGWGKIDSRKVFVAADDFSVRGGHADGGIQGKAAHGEALATQHRVPLIRLLDGSSGGGSVATYLTLGATYIPPLAGLGQSMTAMATVPVASALLGPVVGLASAKAVISHFSVMVKGLSQLFAAGPPVVKQATYEDLSKEALGGWEIHGRNGTVDNVANSELDAFLQIRTFLSFLPSSVHAMPPVVASSDPADRKEEALISIIPRRRARTYDIRKLVQLLVDRVDASPGDQHTASTSSFFEIGATWGRSVVTGLARLRGMPVGILTSDCTVGGGALDALGNQKAARFVNLCDQFGIPLLNLVDQPGFAIGSVAERTATIRHAAAIMAALYHATIPIFTVIIRRAFGVAGGAVADSGDGLNTRVAWPSADWGSLPLEGGVEAAYKRQLDSAPTPAAREKMMKDLLAQFEDVRDPLRTAQMFGIEEIIDPRDTRPLACKWISHAYTHLLPPRLVAIQASAAAKPRKYKL
ncbi:propionyl-CoA carboxylase [Trametes versicolor FP-101664 SS1]|uniref:propionyl-CoA carboxylase n=1 Tax=Trametes versicolor (strain FP-101664) TaxID=717944 RepID=UPI000462464F|nr:propionyl-CoA carboxylase [Trametes versicolor FP-101664 SS1]EIW55545.1 propionyl-CoA carboxylase [Trametes versicolor FP-101664 SS1]